MGLSRLEPELVGQLGGLVGLLPAELAPPEVPVGRGVAVDGPEEIEVVDVFKEPQRAILEGIRMTPTLLKLSPLPIRRIVGTLIDTHRVIETLGLDTHVA